jgi:hypothetical protein
MLAIVFKRLGQNLINLLILCAYIVGSEAQGQEYKPPSSPPLFESNGEVGTPLQFPKGPYVAVGAGFGQSRTAGGTGNPIPAYNASTEVGYVANTGSWSRFEAGAEFFFGKVGHSKADLPIGFGVIAKVGKGYSLGSKFFGVWRLGAGMVQAKYSGTTTSGQKVIARDPVLGTALQLSYLLVMPVTSFLSVVGGAEWTNMSFNISKADDAQTGNEVANIDENIVINDPKIQVGIRFGI